MSSEMLLNDAHKALSAYNKSMEARNPLPASLLQRDDFLSIELSFLGGDCFRDITDFADRQAPELRESIYDALTSTYEMLASIIPDPSVAASYSFHSEPAVAQNIMEVWQDPLLDIDRAKDLADDSLTLYGFATTAEKVGQLLYHYTHERSRDEI